MAHPGRHEAGLPEPEVPVDGELKQPEHDERGAPEPQIHCLCPLVVVPECRLPLLHPVYQLLEPRRRRDPRDSRAHHARHLGERHARTSGATMARWRRMSQGDLGSHRGVCGGRGGDARREIRFAHGSRCRPLERTRSWRAPGAARRGTRRRMGAGLDPNPSPSLGGCSDPVSVELSMGGDYYRACCGEPDPDIPEGPKLPCVGDKTCTDLVEILVVAVCTALGGSDSAAAQLSVGYLVFKLCWTHQVSRWSV
ncbi:hypothetical protein Zm00014a_008390 [Zea mays]|uniref:Uncharacterized protein n=1 Tax=Zea mays TaxID=4577 RepID=A0A317Y2X3_MAIZE|nr:hypothetical protein Zm00014a_008390 [Zea mays]